MQHAFAVTAANHASDRAMLQAGAAALARYATHAATHFALGRRYDTLWACRMAAVLRRMDRAKCYDQRRRAALQGERWPPLNTSRAANRRRSAAAIRA